MMSASGEEPSPLSAGLVDYYRNALRVHANDPLLGVCPICQVNRCRDFISSWERLVCAGVNPDADGEPDEQEGASVGHERWADLIRREQTGYGRRRLGPVTPGALPTRQANPGGSNPDPDMDGR